MTALLPCCESTSGGSINMFRWHNYLFKTERRDTHIISNKLYRISAIKRSKYLSRQSIFEYLGVARPARLLRAAALFLHCILQYILVLRPYIREKNVPHILHFAIMNELF